MTKKPGWQAVHGRFADVQPGSMAFAFPIRSLLLSRLTSTTLMLDIETMDAEQTIAEIERLERIFAVPDKRPLSPSDIAAANQRHDKMLANSPWFRLWQSYGVCCRPQSTVFQLGEIES
jgi:hypothetical protein